MDVNVIHKVQTLIIHDNKELYRRYMPFLKNGGIFLNFNEDINPQNIFPGQKISLSLTLPNKDKIPVQGKVVWINVSKNQSQGFPQGYGISFIENVTMKSLKERIEVDISEFGTKRETTYTL